MIKYTALIIEPRKHKALEFVLHNICDCLSTEWQIILFHGTTNKEYSDKIVLKLKTNFKHKIILVNIGVENLEYPLGYSKMLATRSIVYDYINTDMFLIFQTDSMIFKKNKHFIELFLEYDYVGAPWLKTNYIWTKNCDFIGNGGFSLRNTKKMLEIIDSVNWYSFDDNHGFKLMEDLFFASNHPNIIVKKPDYDNALLFSVDEVFSPETFACHKPWFHSHFEILKTIYPECEVLRQLQGV